ncbi:DUF6300 family protein [Streptomyces sp. NPDC052043]|uniref:DUF6300 family protein n=1 Tax=Streptomyces sp. NPDC052043 TaxID=3365684 RepID=UPI0037D608C0
MTGTQDEDSILLKVSETPPCPRCGDNMLLLAQYQYSWTNSRGEDVPGIKEVALCSPCDRKDPAAAELLVVFAADGQVLPKNVAAFGGLVAAWIESVRQRTVDEALLVYERKRWQQGDL